MLLRRPRAASLLLPILSLVPWLRWWLPEKRDILIYKDFLSSPSSSAWGTRLRKSTGLRVLGVPRDLGEWSPRGIVRTEVRSQKNVGAGAVELPQGRLNLWDLKITEKQRLGRWLEGVPCWVELGWLPSLSSTCHRPVCLYTLPHCSWAVVLGLYGAALQTSSGNLEPG